MRVALTVICLFGLALGQEYERQGLSDADTAMVNDMMDVLDSGLNREAGVDEKSRALFISLTLTSTMTNLDTKTVTKTVTESCVVNAAGGTTFTECTANNRQAPSTSSISEAPITSTTSDSSESTTSDSSTSTTSSPETRRSIDLLVDHINKGSVDNDEHISEVSDLKEEYKEEYKNELNGDVTVVRDFKGERQEVSISEIMPSKVKRNELDVDFVVNADETELQSGSMSWSEASVDKAHSACGRSGLKGDKKRARILALANETVTKSLTSTHTKTVTDTDNTATFTIGIACTNAGFMFQHPMCS